MTIAPAERSEAGATRQRRQQQRVLCSGIVILEETPDPLTVIFANCVFEENAAKRLGITSEPTRDQPIEVSRLLHLRP